MVKDVNDINNENVNTEDIIDSNIKERINDQKSNKTEKDRKNNSKTNNTSTIDKILKVLMIAVFILYIITVLYATLFGRRTRGYTDFSIWEYSARFMNLVPFKSIGLYLKWIMDSNRENNYVPIVNLGVNLILLLPMGYFLPELFKKLKNFFLYTLVCFLFLAFIEVIQLFTRLGSFDVDDLILNMFGAFVGFGLCVLLKKIFKRKSK